MKALSHLVPRMAWCGDSWAQWSWPHTIRLDTWRHVAASLSPHVSLPVPVRVSAWAPEVVSRRHAMRRSMVTWSRVNLGTHVTEMFVTLCFWSALSCTFGTRTRKQENNEILLSADSVNMVWRSIDLGAQTYPLLQSVTTSYQFNPRNVKLPSLSVAKLWDLSWSLRIWTFVLLSV